MKSAKQILSTALLKEGYSYIEKNPVQNIPKIINWVEKLAIKEETRKTIQMFKEITSDQDNNWNKFILRVMNELNPKARSKFFMNYMVNAGIFGAPQIDKMKAKYNCNIPWAVLMDPTAACNLSCTGCWAQEYKKTDSLSYEILDRIINEGKELGIYVYIFSGGEPLLRKKDLIRLTESHDDCSFLAFTNATAYEFAVVPEIYKE